MIMMSHSIMQDITHINHIKTLYQFTSIASFNNHDQKQKSIFSDVMPLVTIMGDHINSLKARLRIIFNHQPKCMKLASKMKAN